MKKALDFEQMLDIKIHMIASQKKILKKVIWSIDFSNFIDYNIHIKYLF